MMARWMLLYRDDNSSPKSLVVDDTTNGNLPFDNAATILRDHDDDFNDGAGVFIVALPDQGEPDVYDADTNEEVGREFVDL